MNYKFEEIKEKLKESFFGIDEQIDQVVNSFETWMTIKDYQTRPLTICLWGLTGTGKTALLNKTIELLKLEQKKFYIKFGSKTSDLGEYFKSNNCDDSIFVLDEFQYFRTKDDGHEMERDENNSTNIVWELLDGGIINLYGNGRTFIYERYKMINLIRQLNILKDANVTLKDGLLYHKDLIYLLKELGIEPQRKYYVDRYKQKLSTNYKKYNKCYYKESVTSDEETMSDEEISSVKTRSNIIEEDAISFEEATIEHIMDINTYDLFDYVFNCDFEKNIFQNKNDIELFFKNCKSLDDLICFIKELINSKSKPNIRDFTKSIIFVIGNLDECFTMSNDLNSDLDADYFYNKTKKITILNIRKALLNRFRAEQIARLGSTHIIYPSLNKEAFKKIINKELLNCSDMLIKNFRNKISEVRYSDEIKKLIYNEGVLPVIGARQIFSTVNEIITDKISYIIKKVLEFKNENSIIISYNYNSKTKNIIVSIINDKNNILIENNFKYILKLENLRIENNKGRQAHRAVHESGHAVCSIILTHSFPETIQSVIIGDKFGGFTLNANDRYYLRKNNYLNSIATDLGGYVAESLVFGSENIADGSSSDIKTATEDLSSLFKECGFIDKKVGKYVSRGFTSTMFENANYSIFDDDEISKKIEQDIENSIELATKTLKNHWVLFLKLSEYLSKNPKITNKKIKEFTKKYINQDYTTFETIIEDEEAFYSDKLIENLKKL